MVQVLEVNLDIKNEHFVHISVIGIKMGSDQ